jgi:hypothetical protein
MTAALTPPTAHRDWEQLQRPHEAWAFGWEATVLVYQAVFDSRDTKNCQDHEVKRYPQNMKHKHNNQKPSGRGERE